MPETKTFSFLKSRKVYHEVLILLGLRFNLDRLFGQKSVASTLEASVKKDHAEEELVLKMKRFLAKNEANRRKLIERVALDLPSFNHEKALKRLNACFEFHEPKKVCEPQKPLTLKQLVENRERNVL